MKVIIKTILIYTSLILFLMGCHSSWGQQIPDGEIIYMAGYYGLGFIQPDGTQNQFIQTKVDLAKPVWSTDGKFLYGLSISGHVGNYGGYPAYWDLERGQFKVCSRGFPFFYQIQNMGKPGKPFEVIVMYVWEIKVVDLSNCRVIQTFVDYSTRPGDYSITGFSYSSSRQSLVYGLVNKLSTGREYKILSHDTISGDEIQIAEGINPTWSPDGTQIAYLGVDGLYVMESNGANPKRLVNYIFFDPYRPGNPGIYQTIPRWSQDGEWLIYHRCSTKYPCMIEDSNIYKVHISGGSEEMIIKGGKYPSWSDR